MAKRAFGIVAWFMATASVLVACTAPEGPAQPTIAGPICPDAGIEAVQSDGQVVRHLGAAADDPETCLVRINGERTERRLYAYFPTPNPHQAAQRTAQRILRPLAPGRRAHFNEYYFSTFSGSFRLLVTWRVLGTERITIGSRAFDAFVVEISRQQPEARYASNAATERIWLDRESNLLLRRTVPVAPFLTRAEPIEVVKVSGP